MTEDIGFLDMVLVKRYAELEMKYRSAQADLTETRNLLENLEVTLKQQMDMYGLENISIEVEVSPGVRRSVNVYQTPALYVSKKSDESGATTEVIVNELRSLGMGYMVKDGISMPTLKSWISEQDKAGNSIPESLLKLLNVVRTSNISVRLK
jgi:hypothetical protein